MINVTELKKIIRLNGLTQHGVAMQIGMSRGAFNTRLQKGIFGSDEIERLVSVLQIKNPEDIFFAK